MRISDWSSDVCSSDLSRRVDDVGRHRGDGGAGPSDEAVSEHPDDPARDETGTPEHPRPTATAHSARLAGPSVSGGPEPGAVDVSQGARRRADQDRKSTRLNSSH